ncbi:MAG: excinuclease ABC subunit UvrC [Gemmatimonadaceae bacterium]|nr:excinuclease ABC subunit UvrC [Gemmatimonadaceae bacterium]MDQ3519324.1 excinuclease ABC subunit UvrC [Gemmatimonadota bacterium]
MQDVPDPVRSKIANLPESPGVYLWKDAAGKILYVGKAKRLRSRVRNYYSGDHIESVKTRALMRQVADFETIVVPSEPHALILEANLIKEHHPKFNIALRDDKSYPYIRVTVHEPFPRIFVTRQLVNDGSRYFGPYTDVGAMRRALNVVKRIFTVRSCNYDMPKEVPERPCLDHYIGRCKAPCVVLQTEEDYRAMIDEVVLFLSGRAEEVTRRVRARMDEASQNLDFERAGELRDALKHLERMEEPTIVVKLEGGSTDVIGYARDGDDACVTILRIRDGKLLARDHNFVENVTGEEDATVLSTYLARTYLPSSERAPELLVPFDFEDRDILEAALQTTKVRAPQRGPRRDLLGLAEQNARHLLEELKLNSMEADERAADPVYELQRELGLQRVPRAFVCFDISTTQGTDTVGSCVWFENGRPKRAEYRKFKIKTVQGTDDFASMREVVSRYLTRRLEEQKPLPDLIVIDGGKGQLGVAQSVLESLGLSRIPLLSLAKREEDIFMSGRSEPLRLARRSPALRLLQRSRDEAHRFAVTYNRKRRTMRTITSELLKVPGIGPTKRRALLQAFGSVQGVRDASEADIAKLPGFTGASARRLLVALGALSALEPAPQQN